MIATVHIPSVEVHIPYVADMTGPFCAAARARNGAESISAKTDPTPLVGFFC